MPIRMREILNTTTETLMRAWRHLTPELSCKGTYKNARVARIIDSSFDSFNVG